MPLKSVEKDISAVHLPTFDYFLGLLDNYPIVTRRIKIFSQEFFRYSKFLLFYISHLLE